jgi:hypothetical protein
MSEAFKAFQKFQAELGTLPRRAEVNVGGARSSYKFKYAPLEDIIAYIRPLMAEHDLYFTQAVVPMGETCVGMRTRVYYKDGTVVEEGIWPMKFSGVSPKDIGGTATYWRRYGLSTLLGLATEDDTDAPLDEDETLKDVRHGKLSRSDLMKRMRALVGELRDAPNRDVFAELLVGEGQMIAQFEKDMPNEWAGPVEDGVPWRDAIEGLRDKLPAMESEDAF